MAAIQLGMLHDEGRLLTAVVEAADDAIFTKELDGTILSWNPAAERMYGYPAREIVGTPVARLEPPDRRGEIAGILRKVSSDERVERLQTVRLARDGRRIDVLVTVVPLHDSGGSVVGAASIARDITDRIRLGEELRAAQRLEAVGRLAGGVAHEFNDILVTIGGYADLVLDDLSSDDPRRASVASIRRAADRAAMLTTKLLAVGQQQPLTMRILDIDRIVEHAQPAIARLSGEDVRLQVLAGAPRGRVRADAGQLEEALVSIVRALVARMPDRGTLTIATLDAEDAVVGLPAARGPAVRVVLSDTGPAIDDDAVRHLFEPFAAATDATHGLDLATAHGIVAQSGGRMVAQTGTTGLTIRIDLPVETEIEPPTPIDVHQRPRGGSESILLVDDDADARELMRRVLDRYGYSVQTAASGEEAIARVVDYFAEPVDLLVVDVVLTGMTGPELSDRLRADRPHLAVLYVSGYTPNTVAYHGLDGLDEPLLTKPFTADQLAQSVRSVLDERVERRA